MVVPYKSLIFASEKTDKYTTMARKVCNNKVEFTACGKTVMFRLSDKELRMLRRSSIFEKGVDWEKRNYGYLYNFSVFAFFDYDVKGSKCGRFHKEFNYHEFDKMWWSLTD